MMPKRPVAATVGVNQQHELIQPKLKGSELRVSVNPRDMVQSMVERGLKEVPDQFVQPPELRPSQTQAKGILPTIQIPLVDMADIEHEGADQVIQKIGRACEEWGFFQVINHGVSASLMGAAMQMCREFFALPIEEKELYSMKTSSGIGYGRRFAVQEGVRVDWVDRLGFWSATEEHRINDPLNVKRPAAFNATLEEYGDALLKLSHTILAALCRNAGLPPNYLLERVGGAKRAGIRTGMNYYPPCPQPDRVMGLSSHADASVLTLVQQDGVAGLEVLKDGMWVPIPPVANAFVVNIGDQIQMLSNERYKSVVHRALASNGSNGRMSIANFFLPNWETIIQPAYRFYSDVNPPRYEPVKYSDYITAYMKVPLGGRRFIEEFRVPTSPTTDETKQRINIEHPNDENAFSYSNDRGCTTEVLNDTYQMSPKRLRTSRGGFRLVASQYSPLGTPTGTRIGV